ncbi:MAG TPA: hypothetical protein VKB78_00445 [Pirellulales bacterium]|nr:hypothetical protein [Pirellulales bacterium]
MISAEFIAMLRCPETRTPLALADAALLNRINSEIRAGRLRNRGDQVIAEPLDGGLVRQDNAMLYPIVRDIPVLLADEGIPLDQLRVEG